MIRNAKQLRRFEKQFARRSNLTIAQKYRILDALYAEAVKLKVFPLKDPLKGLAEKIRWVRELHRV